MNPELLILLLLPLDAGYMVTLILRRRYQTAVKYFGITRSLATVLIAWEVVTGYAGATTLYPVTSLELIIAVAYLVFVLFTAVVIRKSQLSPRIALTTTIVAVLALLSIPTAYLLFPPGQNHSAVPGMQSVLDARQDTQTVRDFQLLSQDIYNYSIRHGNLPSTIQQAYGQPNSLSDTEHIGDRASYYAYKPGQGRSFQLCATFHGSANSGVSYQGFTVAENHDKGYQCFTYGNE